MKADILTGTVTEMIGDSAGLKDIGELEVT